jgi:hypothetical protein
VYIRYIRKELVILFKSSAEQAIQEISIKLFLIKFGSEINLDDISVIIDGLVFDSGAARKNAIIPNKKIPNKSSKPVVAVNKTIKKYLILFLKVSKLRDVATLFTVLSLFKLILFGIIFYP